MTDTNIRIATSDDEAALVDVITLGFSTDPMARWTLPQAQQYLETMPSFVRAFGGKAFELGTAYYVEAYAGAALWLPPGSEPDGERLVALVKEQAPADRLPDAMRVFEEMGRYHPTGPHWYLPMIAMDPTLQGRGYGSALMRTALARCDQDGLPAYLESSNPRNISLYRRHGFEATGTIQVGSSPVMTPMLRPAR
jgi:ribosomal protein S18 acetylase RimI-like enzyme